MPKKKDKSGGGGSNATTPQRKLSDDYSSTPTSPSNHVKPGDSYELKPRQPDDQSIYGEMGETPSRLGGRELELYSSLWGGRELRAGLFRISRLSDDQDFRAYSTGDARWFQRLHEKDIKGSYTDSKIDPWGIIRRG